MVSVSVRQVTKAACVETAIFSWIGQWTRWFANDLNIGQWTRLLINICSLINEHVDWRMNVRWLGNNLIGVWTGTSSDIQNACDSLALVPASTQILTASPHFSLLRQCPSHPQPSTESGSTLSTPSCLSQGSTSTSSTLPRSSTPTPQPTTPHQHRKRFSVSTPSPPSSPATSFFKCTFYVPRRTIAQFGGRYRVRCWLWILASWRLSRGR